MDCNKEPHLLVVLKYEEGDSYDHWKLSCNDCRRKFWMSLESVQPDLSFCPWCSDKRRLDHVLRGPFSFYHGEFLEEAYLSGACEVRTNGLAIRSAARSNRTYWIEDEFGIQRHVGRAYPDAVEEYDRERNVVFVFKSEGLTGGISAPFDLTGDWLPLDEFLFAAKLWRDPIQPNRAEFRKSYFAYPLEYTWTDGKEFGGPWKALARVDQETFRAHHVEVARQCSVANFKALWRLPHPRKFVLQTLQYGRARGLTGVPYSAALCAWMERRLNRLNKAVFAKLF